MNKLSTVARNARLDAILIAIGASAILRIRSGVAPASVGSPDSGVSLANMTLPAVWLDAASGGVVGLAGAWGPVAAAANGFAGHYRIYASDGVTAHMQGLCSQAWAAASAWSLGQQVNNGGLVYRCTTAGTSAGAGGPTGTGAGITDGTAVWDYVGDVGIVLLNTSIASGQPVSVTSFTLTDGNA